MSPTALSGSLTINWQVASLAAITGLNPTSSTQPFTGGVNWDFGAGAGQIQETYVAVRTLAASSSETLDLIGALVGLYGETLNFARIKSILICLLANPYPPASSITIGNAASHPWLGPLGGTTPSITLTPGDPWAITRSDATGWVVTAGSAENLKITNNDGANAAKYFIALDGCTS